MGAYLSAPVTTKEVFEGGNAALSYGGATMQVSVRFRGVKTVRAPPSQARAMVWWPRAGERGRGVAAARVFFAVSTPTSDAPPRPPPPPRPRLPSAS